MMDFEDSKQHREEVLREAETNRLAKALRTARKRRTSRASLLVWELKTIAGRLLNCQGSEEVSRFVISGTTLATAGEPKGAGRRCCYPSHPPLCWCFTVGEQDESEIPGEEVCRGKEADNKAEMMESVSVAALRCGQSVSDEQEV